MESQKEQRLSNQVTMDASRDESPDAVSHVSSVPDRSLRKTQVAPGQLTLASTAFWGFLTTQFLGAFNDNYFKQMVLLISASNVAVVAGKGAANPDRQSLAMAAFALPFVLLSGLGGYMSDRFSKQYVIIGSKVAEIVIMAIAFVVLLIPGLSADAQLMWLISVLFLMGGQSAIFGPSKYGILPEVFRADKLLPVNGAVQMTTFLAIIFGTACAGVALDSIREFLWIGSVIAVGIAVAGTVSSFLVPRIRAAEPNLKIRVENSAIPADVARLVLRERGLLKALLVAAVFWFLGGVTQMAVNTLGKSSMGLSSTRTSLMVAAIGFGIAAGCAMTGLCGGNGNGRRWVTGGAWLLFVSLSLIAFLGSGQLGVPASSGVQGEGILTGLVRADLLEWSLRCSMTLLGFAAGMFVVPVQVYLQQAPPAALKGRLLGVQNLVTWIGILLSAAYFAICGVVLNRFGGQNGESRYQWIVFVSLAALMLPICFFYRLPKVDADKRSEAR